MIFILNYIVHFVLLIGGFICYKRYKKNKNIKQVIVGVVVMIFLAFVVNSLALRYAPKGKVTRLERAHVQPVKPETKIVDRTLKPKQNDEQRTEALENKMTWKEEVEKIEEPKQ